MKARSVLKSKGDCVHTIRPRETMQMTTRRVRHIAVSDNVLRDAYRASVVAT